MPFYPYNPTTDPYLTTHANCLATWNTCSYVPTVNHYTLLADYFSFSADIS